MLALGAGSALGLAAAGGAIGWIGRRLAGPDRNVTLVEPAAAATLPPGGDFPTIAGLSPEVTSAEDHYIVDIDLVKPVVEAAGWTLTVKGEVENPLKLTFASLQDGFEVVEDFSVLTCISNEVGGPLVGHSAWGGVRLRDVLEEARPRENTVDVVFTAADGYKDSIPLEAAMDPAVILAVTQNGEPLSQGHGFPCRVRVPAIYGMKNVKWVRSIELVSRDYKGYWMQRGWSDEAIIRTQSRIDVAGDDLAASVGEQTWIAGVAWAGDRGVTKVEVTVDGGRSWNEAELKRPASDISWRLWAYAWTPEESGTAVVMCRATDGTGEVQTTTERPPHPSGASGLHTIEIDVN
jgi:DMSO/TMAO reductase YedYZ molybdopterin-dependent catalytic subunit